MQYRFSPIQQWPRPLTKNREPSRFRASHSQTLELLSKELECLGAKNVLIQLTLTSGEIRRDGMPRADARTQHPGVILSFDSRFFGSWQGRIAMPCDKFTTWQENLRAIALTLERLRLADLYGVTQHGEQYRGWAELPAPPKESGIDTVEAAVRFLSVKSGIESYHLFNGLDEVERAYRAAAKACHPDRGGNHEDFVKLGQALAILREHHKL